MARLPSASVKASPAKAPTQTLNRPVVIDIPASKPTAVLYTSVAVVKFCAAKADVPIAVDLLPIVSAPKAPLPTATL